MPSVIALDAMGSDKSPRPEVDGALQAVRQYGVQVMLVGREPQIRAELERYSGVEALPIEIIHASEVIEMGDKAAQAVRAKRDSSQRVGLRLVREGRAAGFVTAGNTGAAMSDQFIGRQHPNRRTNDHKEKHGRNGTKRRRACFSHR